MADHLLEVRNLSVEFHTVSGVVHAVKDVSYHIDRGETLAILGESGSGKSVSSSAIMNLIDMPPGRIGGGKLLLDGKDLLTMPTEARREINGRRIAIIFQDPLSHLNPVYTVGWQIREAMTTHGMGKAAAGAALRNAMLPVITVIGDQAASLLNGAVVVETIFGFPGVGKLMIDSILQRDFNVVLAAILVTALAIFLMNLLIDIAYALLDPRIRH